MKSSQIMIVSYSVVCVLIFSFSSSSVLLIMWELLSLLSKVLSLRGR